MSNGKNGAGWDADRTEPEAEAVRHRPDGNGGWVEAYRAQLHKRHATSTTPAFGPNDRREVMVPPIERRIAVLRERLNETNGFDQHTGQPRHTLQGSQRDAAERELHQLVNYTLPQTIKMADMAEAWHAENTPTPEQKLQEQMEQRERIAARAREINDERRAEIQAAVMRKAEDPDATS